MNRVCRHPGYEGIQMHGQLDRRYSYLQPEDDFAFATVRYFVILKAITIFSTMLSIS